MASNVYFNRTNRMATASRSRSLLFAVMFAVTVAADDGDDFANNLFSDLAPLLALFGERVTMQFMSQSLGWADNVILAMVPLGIITIITSAIRVGGPSFLKALIGRARENLAVAEQELMSSTSKEVCELWNGHEVVRCMGSCPVTEFICLLPRCGIDDNVKVKVKNFGEVLGKQLDQNETNSKTSSFGDLGVEENGLKPNESSSSTIIVTRNPRMDAPNISLNSHNRTSRFELRTVAVLGTILQSAVLVFSACAVYHPALKFSKDGTPVAAYAFPCNIVGTLLLVTGMLLCAHVVESSTGEETFRPSRNFKAQLVWLQQTKTVNDQMFDSFAIYTRAERTVITTSERKVHDKMEQDESNKSSVEGSGPLTNQQFESTPTYTTNRTQSPQVSGKSVSSESIYREGEVKTVLELKTTIGTIIGLCGFIVQFVGLRGLHWSASIAQLGAVLLMTGLKAWVRRGLAEPPHCQKVLSEFELDWFATTFADVKKAIWRPDGHINETKSWTLERLTATQTGLVRHNMPQTDEQPISGADHVVKIRRDLAQLASWHGPASVEAIAIARSIEAMMDFLFPDNDHPKTDVNYTWVLESPKQGEVRFRLRRENGKWQAYADELEAALSLWLFSVYKVENNDKNRPDELPIGDAQDDKWLRAKGVFAKKSLRILGSYSQSLHRDLSWRIPHETTRIIRLTETDNGANPAQTLNVENHRIVGFKEFSQSSGGQTIFKVKEPPEFRVDEDNHQHSEYYDSQNGKQDDTNSTAAQRKDNYNQCFLSVEFNGSLKSLFAQDIFSSFLMAAAKTVKRPPFTEPVEIQPDNNTSSQAWESISLQSDQLIKFVKTIQGDQLMKLAKTIQDTGLGSLDDIYLSLIPPLSAAHKLPQVTRAIDLSRHRAEPHEKLQRWEEASDAYLWLFLVAKTFPEDSKFVTRATAVIMEFLRQVKSALDLYEILEDERQETLRPLQQRLELELRNSDKIEDTYYHLLNLYTAQQRPWNGAVISQETEYEFPKEFNLTRMHGEVLEKGVHLSSYDIEETKRDLNTKDVLGWAPLHYVVGQGISVEQVFSTVKSELAVSSQDLLGHTPLHWACGTKYEDRPAHSSIPIPLQNIRTLLQWGAEINTQGRDGVAPIHCAAKSGDLQATRFLVESGANIDIQDASGKTPLLWSMVGGNQATVEYLWENANTKLRDDDGRTALHLAVVFADDETVAWLLEHGADAQAVDRRIRTPLHQSGQTGRLRAMQLLYQRDKAGVNAKDAMSYTPLFLAARAGHRAVAEWLIKKGADINAKDSSGQTLLHIAAKADDRAVMRWLIQAGADVNTGDGDDRTPLHLAAEDGHEAVVKWLTQEAGADLNAKDGFRRTVLHFAVLNGHEAMVEWLITAGAKVNAKDDNGQTALHLAARNGHEAVIQWLITAGAKVNAKDDNGHTALHLAARNGHEAVVKWLVQKAGAELNAKDGFRRTALHFAIINGHEATVEWLIIAGAEVNAKDDNGQTALHLAAKNGHEAVIQWLIKAGADINAKDYSGQTALHLAARNGHEAIVESLVKEAGADVSMRDSRGRTASHLAAENGYEPLRKWLIEEEARAAVEAQQSV